MNATERSIFEQFPFWGGVPDIPRPDPSLPVVVIGCGSSYHLAFSVAALLNEAGTHAMAVPGGEWWLRPQAYVPAGTRVQVVAISRSGESSETVRAAERSRADGHRVTAFTCTPDSSLVRAADTVVSAATHAEEGIVMTSSASLMLLMGLHLAGHALEPGTVAAAGILLDQVSEAAPSLLAGREHFVFLGTGPLWGIAREGALKLQEMSLAMVEAYPTLDYRHGPISLADERTLVVMLDAPDAAADETKLVGELQARGARVLGLGGAGDVRFDVQGQAALRGLTLLPALQILGERLAQAKGLDTAAPRGLTKVIVLG